MIGLMVPIGLAGQTRLVLNTDDGGQVVALQSGRGLHGVVLAHGGRFTKESWRAEAAVLAAKGFRVLAIDFRGFGESAGPGGDDPLNAPLHRDVLAAVRYLRGVGMTSVSVIGGSMGGMAAAQAAIEALPGEIDNLVLLAPSAVAEPERIPGRKLFIAARGDTTAGGALRLVRIQAQFDRTPEPKTLLLMDGQAHAQALFRTSQGPRLVDEILGFLGDPLAKRRR